MPGVACIQRKKKYDTPPEHAGPYRPSPLASGKVATSAETSVMAKPAWVYSLSRAGIMDVLRVVKPLAPTHHHNPQQTRTVQPQENLA